MGKKKQNDTKRGLKDSSISDQDHSNLLLELQKVTAEEKRLIQKKIMELSELNKALQSELVECKRIEKEMLDIAQEEQRSVGAQLHDGICQDLTGIMLFTKNLIQRKAKGTLIGIQDLQKIANMLYEAVRQVRDTARGLYPGELEESSLMDCLHELASRTQSLYGTCCRFFCSEPIHFSNSTTAMHLYRIAQEGVSNAVIHGKASVIDLYLSQNSSEIKLYVKDNGRGMEQDKKHSKGIGLKIMKYRAHLMNAILLIEPNIPNGVILNCILSKNME